MMADRCVWLAQCLCPERHAILAAAREAEGRLHAVAIVSSLRETIETMIAAGEINPWCGLCYARSDTWHYELGRTRFTTMQEAEPEMRKAERNQGIIRGLAPRQ